MNIFRFPRLIIVLLSLAAFGMAAAQETTDELKPPELPSDEERAAALANAPQSTETPQSTDDENQNTVSSFQSVQQKVEAGQIVTEYRRHGELYLMSVKPRLGPTQYWNDSDGDGQLQTKHNGELGDDFNLPKWKLGSW